MDTQKNAKDKYREERKARIAKAAKRDAKKHNKVILNKTSKAVIAVIVVIAIAAGIGAFAINNSGVLERGKLAFKVGDIEVTSAEYGYYYASVFNNYMNYSYQYDTYYGTGMGALYTGYDWSTSPDAQAYNGEIEGIEEPMFTDFFAYSAKESIKYVKSHLIYAEENGITLDEDDLKTVEETYAKIEEQGTSSGGSLSAFLRNNYGKGMSKELLKQVIEEQTLASKVQEIKTAEFTESYSEKEVNKAYEKGISSYGYVSLRSYTIEAEAVTEGEGDEATESVTDETMADAKAKAEAFKAAVTDEKSFKTLASDYEKDAENESYKDFLTDDTKTLIEDATQSSLGSDEDFIKWAFDEDTAKDSTYILETEGEGYTVYMMVEPLHKAPDSFTYDVRHILLQFPEEEATEEGEEETEETEETEEIEVELLNPEDYKDITVDIDVDLEKTTDKALYKEAQDILKGYLDGDRTEKAFAALAVEHSADSNAADGGIYENVTEGYMLSEFEDWALAKGRVKGDVGIVETSNGYHIMYFIGTETTTWADTIKADLAATDYNEFSEELLKKDNVKISEEVESAYESVEAFVVKLAKTQIMNASASSSSY